MVTATLSDIVSWGLSAMSAHSEHSLTWRKKKNMSLCNNNTEYRPTFGQTLTPACRLLGHCGDIPGNHVGLISPRILFPFGVTSLSITITVCLKNVYGQQFIPLEVWSFNFSLKLANLASLCFKQWSREFGLNAGDVDYDSFWGVVGCCYRFG